MVRWLQRNKWFFSFPVALPLQNKTAALSIGHYSWSHQGLSRSRDCRENGLFDNSESWAGSGLFQTQGKLAKRVVPQVDLHSHLVVLKPPNTPVHSASIAKRPNLNFFQLVNAKHTLQHLCSRAFSPMDLFVGCHSVVLYLLICNTSTQ